MNKIQEVVNTGVEPENKPYFNTTIKIQNAFSVVCIFFATFFNLLMIKFGYWNATIIFVFLQIGLAVTIWLNKQKKYVVSKNLLLLLIVSALPVLSWVLGYKAEFYIYYFVVPIFAMSLFGFNERVKLMRTCAVFILSMATTYGLYFFDVPSVIKIDATEQLILKSANFIVGFLIVTLLTYNIVKQHYKLSAELIDINEHLLVNKEELEQTIEQKNVLNAEVHHRVKNNLAIISSLLNLQLGQSNNKEVKDSLQTSVNRIRSMGLIHEILYSENNLKMLNIREYIELLTTELAQSYSNKSYQVNVRCNLEDVVFNLDKAIPCGILINELVTNAFKHAFKNRDKGEVAVSLVKTGDAYELKVQDDGVGMNENDEKREESIGLMLIETLTDQLEGSLNYETNNGTVATIKFQ